VALGKQSYELNHVGVSASAARIFYNYHPATIAPESAPLFVLTGGGPGAAVLFLLDAGGCAKHRLPGGLSKLKPCRLAEIDEELFCGKLTVFENRETRTGRTIDLNVVVLPAFDQKHKAEPLFDLAGGPGAASTEAAAFYVGPGKAYRRRHDVVCVDQRGTGKSNRLAIPREKTPQYYLSEMFPVDYVRQMRHELEQRADLTKYTTSIAMDDLDDVRTWLGYDRINLFGASYGTQAALVYMRRHTENVRSAILLAVAPADLKMPLHHSESAARAMDLLFGECEQDATCHAAFPQIRDDWKNVLTQLEKTARACGIFSVRQGHADDSRNSAWCLCGEDQELDVRSG
jgi:pimeloyl-ACP methyl ester carboxylesterase